MKYEDFEVDIGVGEGSEYLVSVLRSPAGEAHAKMIFPFDELALENRLLHLQNSLLRSGGKHRQILSPEHKVVQEFGQALFDAIMTGEIRSRYDISRHQALQAGKGLRLKLRIQSPKLAVLPWEFLYDARQGDYIVLSRNTPIVRYLELPQPIQTLEIDPPLQILGMVVSPNNLQQLDIEVEKQRIESALNSLQQAGLVQLTWLVGQTWRDLQRAMRGGPWHIFHFVGHGGFDISSDEGLIVLADEQNQAHMLRASHVGQLLANHLSLRLVLLNACEGARGGQEDIFSSTASILVRRGIPAVLGMQYSITDQAAIEFARSFYEALTDSMPIDAAVCEARMGVNIAVPNTLEWGVPVLYTRAPDGVLFGIHGKADKLSSELKQEYSALMPDQLIVASEQEVSATQPTFNSPRQDFAEPLQMAQASHSELPEESNLLHQETTDATTKRSEVPKKQTAYWSPQTSSSISTAATASKPSSTGLAVLIQQKGWQRATWKRLLSSVLVVFAFLFVGVWAGEVIYGFSGRSNSAYGFVGAIPVWLVGIILLYRVWRHQNDA